jgi:hypothetical protein
MKSFGVNSDSDGYFLIVRVNRSVDRYRLLLRFILPLEDRLQG